MLSISQRGFIIPLDICISVNVESSQQSFMSVLCQYVKIVMCVYMKTVSVFEVIVSFACALMGTLWLKMGCCWYIMDCKCSHRITQISRMLSQI